MGSITIQNIVIEWLGHAGFRIRGAGQIVYIDPYLPEVNIAQDDKANILLITDEDEQHCHPVSIRNVRRSDATTLIPEDLGLQFRGDARRVAAGDSLCKELSIKGVDIEVLPGSGERANELGTLSVGYMISLDGLRIYHPGKATSVKEMKDLDIDIALLPISGQGTMDKVQAIEAATLLMPKVVIPMCYKKNEEAVQFAEMASARGIKTIIPDAQ